MAQYIRVRAGSLPNSNEKKTRNGQLIRYPVDSRLGATLAELSECAHACTNGVRRGRRVTSTGMVRPDIKD